MTCNGVRIGLGLLVAALVAGCRPAEQGELQVVVIGEDRPELVDPAAQPVDAASLVLVESVAQGLVRFDAAGNIAPGMAERWAVSDDGLTYTFRLRKGDWGDGRRVRARDVVRLLQRQVASGSRNPIRDTVGAIRQIVAMTDRVVAIQLSAPRSQLLQLLAQPEFGLVRERSGTGPFALSQDGETLVLTRSLPGTDGAVEAREQVRLSAASAGAAIASFKAGKADVVLGGTSGDLALALGAGLPRGVLRIDPAVGLFGLAPARRDGIVADPEVRALLDEAIDREALVAALGLPQLQPRTSLLQPGQDTLVPAEPAWSARPLTDRRPELVSRARELFGAVVEPAEPLSEGSPTSEASPTVIRVALPNGPGGAILLQRLKADWVPLGLDVQEAEAGQRADLKWVDAVAPSSSPAWFLRQFRCAVAPICLPDADRLLDAARLTGFAPQRTAFFAEAERQMRAEVLFIPVAAPIRWSLTARSITGFAENRFARHPLTDLREAPGARD